MILPALFCLIAQDAKLELAPMTSGLFDKIHGYQPMGIKLSPEKPAGVTRAPEGTLRYGSVTAAGKAFIVALGDGKLYVDTNGNGDLTDDPATTWASHPGRNGQKDSFSGTFTLNIPIQGQTVSCTYGVYDAGEEGYLGAYADYALVGKMTLGDKAYDTIYSDPAGLWTGKGMLLIDKDGDGKFNPNYEFYRAAEPFNIGGTTYEFKADGSHFSAARSSKKVEERTATNSAPPDPNLANGLVAGKSMIPFDATTMKGTKVAFPKSYAGKIVLLDFWATWCGPCMREVPNVVKAYQTYHDQGFEVLGVTLDRAKAEEQIGTVTGKAGMTWEQIYDGNYFDAAVAKKYGIKAIPAAYLVDGDTGKIIACGDSIRGEKLGEAIKKALAQKSTK